MDRITGKFKWGWRSDSPQLDLSNNNRFAMFSKVMDNISYCSLNNEDLLREVTVKIGLERIDTQEEITVEALLDNGVIGLVMSSEFVRKQGFRLKKIDRFFNKEGPIEHTAEVNIYYQGYRERMEIDIIGGQK